MYSCDSTYWLIHAGTLEAASLLFLNPEPEKGGLSKAEILVMP